MLQCVRNVTSGPFCWPGLVGEGGRSARARMSICRGPRCGNLTRKHGLRGQGKPMIDDVVWEGPGASLPDRCWDRQGVILRTLDIVAYKVSCLLCRVATWARRAQDGVGG